MANYDEERAKLRNTKLAKLKSEAKNKPWTTLWETKKNIQGKELSHQLFLTTRQKHK